MNTKLLRNLKKRLIQLECCETEQKRVLAWAAKQTKAKTVRDLWERCNNLFWLSWITGQRVSEESRHYLHDGNFKTKAERKAVCRALRLLFPGSVYTLELPAE